MWICLHIQTRLPDILSVHSFHVETIVSLSKLDSKRYISVELPIDEVDLTSAESKVPISKFKTMFLRSLGLRYLIYI